MYQIYHIAKLWLKLWSVIHRLLREPGKIMREKASPQQQLLFISLQVIEISLYFPGNQPKWVICFHAFPYMKTAMLNDDTESFITRQTAQRFMSSWKAWGRPGCLAFYGGPGHCSCWVCRLPLLADQAAESLSFPPSDPCIGHVQGDHCILF